MTLIVKWSDSKDTEEMYSKHLSAIFFTYNAILYLNKKDTKTNCLHEIEIQIFKKSDWAKNGLDTNMKNIVLF